MTKLTPIAALAICWLIGIFFGSPGLWFPLGLLAAIAVAMIQKKRGEPRG